MGGFQYRAGEVGITQVGVGQVNSVEIIVGQVGAGQTGAAQISAGQIEPGAAAPVLLSPPGQGIRPPLGQGYMLLIRQEMLLPTPPGVFGGPLPRVKSWG